MKILLIKNLHHAYVKKKFKKSKSFTFYYYLEIYYNLKKTPINIGYLNPFQIINAYSTCKFLKNNTQFLNFN